MVDFESRISTVNFGTPSLSTSGDDPGSPVPEAKDKVNGSILRRPLLTSWLEGRCKRYWSSTTEP